MTGQAASAPESGGLADLASFLADTPETESEDQEEEAQTEDEPTSEEADTGEPSTDEQDAEQGEESDGEELDEEPAPVDKITIKVKGEDGKEESLELTPEDISKSYMRQQDYTRKTQALAERENEAVKFLTQKHEEIRSQYIEQAEITRAAIVQMAGIRSEDEMAQLATHDPAAWVAETNRQRQIENLLSGIDQKIKGEKAAIKEAQEQQTAQQRQQQAAKAWEELSKDGLDRPKLAKIYNDVTSKYGVTGDELANVYDARFVRIMKDAVAYRALQEKKPEVTRKIQNAPRLPTRQTAPAQERLDKALDNKFRAGRAKLNDLVAYLR